MVATAGAGWRLAPCLVALVAEADRRKPSRSRDSDGSIGDTAHSARTSDHNPADGWVCAVDLDDDGDSTPILGVDLLVNHLVASRDPRVKYVIRNGRIWQPTTGWRTYTGINSHSQHAHISIWNTPNARDDVSAWWPTAARPTPPPATPEAPPTQRDYFDMQTITITDQKDVHFLLMPDGPVRCKDSAQAYRYGLGRIPNVEMSTADFNHAMNGPRARNLNDPPVME